MTNIGSYRGDPLLRIGTTFNYLTATEYAGGGKYVFTCVCGNTRLNQFSVVQKGVVKSCGCKQPSYVTTHKGVGSPEYKNWMSMKSRCYAPKCDSYPRYGAKGITVCDRWKNSFGNFLQDMGRRPTPKHSVDRINSSGNYEPNNCRWATKKEQSRNLKNNLYVEINGEKQLLLYWVEFFGVCYQTAYGRLGRKWTPKQALGIDPPPPIKRSRLL